MNSSVRVSLGVIPQADARGWWGDLDRHFVGFSSFLLPLLLAKLFLLITCQLALANCNLQLSAMDVSVRSTMKGAAKCDKHCELQNSVNRQGLERILCFWDIPESMPASVSMLCCSSGCRPLWACCCDCLCLRMCVGALEASDL